MKRQPMLLACWLLVLLLVGLWIQRELTIGTDLRLFMPAASNAEERFLLQEIGESPGSRLLLIAIQGASVSRLAQLSTELTDALTMAEASGQRLFPLVANGDPERNAIPEHLLPYRYLLTDAATRGALETPALRVALTERLRDLASPAAGAIEPWIARDPTLEALHLADEWLPAKEPQRLQGVWFDAAGQTALLVAQTQAAAFDPPRQAEALARLESEFAAASAGSAATVTVSGPGAFAVLMQHRVSSEAGALGAIASASILLLLFWAYRDLRTVLTGLLPLLSAALVGLAVVTLGFGQVHGITLAFGFTLLGVAQDYPIHLFSHRRPGESAIATANRIWRPLTIGVASTCVAYLAFLVAGVPGLAQLAWFTVAGLLTAGLTTRYLLPRLLPSAPRDPSAAPAFARFATAVGRWPRLGWLPLPLAGAAAVSIFLSATPLWENDLSTLTPVPAELLLQDAQLRRELGAPDVRYLVVVHGASAEAALARTEQQQPLLERLVERGVVGSFDNAAKYLPSPAIQLQRRAALPDAERLQASLAEATHDLPFTDDAFAPFLADVRTARELAPLDISALAGTPLELRVGGMLFERENNWISVTTFSDVRDPAALAAGLADAGEHVSLIDMKRASESLVIRQRDHILTSLGTAALVLTLLIALTLRKIRRAVSILSPMLVTTIVTVAVLQLAGISLGLFHLVALALAAGLGLDYALFFEHSPVATEEQRRTLHAVLLCATSTLLVFVLLGSSSVPVLRSIGITVAVGVTCNFLLAFLVARARVRT
ncbi:MAG TPA: MMPL family transporter [Steroidobacteraceae bacterium]|nr:MMPL family transporter [Steroidobacteraceae bacterium]